MAPKKKQTRPVRSSTVVRTSKISFKDRIIGPIKHPIKFFDKLKSDLKTDFKFYVFLSIFSLVGLIIFSLSPIIELAYGPLFGGYILLFGPIFWVIGIFSAFVMAGWYHVWLRVFGGKGSYQDTYAVGVYSEVPAAILFMIPALILMTIGSFSLTPAAITAGNIDVVGIVVYFIGAILALAGSVWALVLMIIGFHKQHKISGGRAFAAWLVSMVIAGIILFVIMFMVVLAALPSLA
ncbi:MAG: Yip1 family protein [Candidatus Aenigmatarchaeota archaeon]